MTDSTDSQAAGGVAWELSEAIRLMGEAVATGDPVAIATAMRRHAEALQNQAYRTLVPSLETVLATVVKAEIGHVTRAITDTITVQDQRFGYVLSQLGEFLEKEDNRHDTYSGELAAIVDGLGGLRADVQHSAAEFSARLGQHDQDIEALTLVVAEHKADHDTRITSLEDYRADMQALRAALAALSARIDSALPTEADQALSTELRGGGDGTP